jgi:hypothetical protein
MSSIELERCSRIARTFTSGWTLNSQAAPSLASTGRHSFYAAGGVESLATMAPFSVQTVVPLCLRHQACLLCHGAGHLT